MKKTVIVVTNDDVREARESEIEKALRDIIYALVQIIPVGHVTTYKSISDVLGLHPRVVAAILRSNNNPIAIPCHRVIKSDGSVGGYTLLGRNDIQFKVKLLKVEGIDVKAYKVPKERIIDLSSLLKILK